MEPTGLVNGARANLKLVGRDYLIQEDLWKWTIVAFSMAKIFAMLKLTVGDVNLTYRTSAESESRSDVLCGNIFWLLPSW